MEVLEKQKIGEWVKSARILIPETLDHKSFVFSDYFGLGDQKTTNLAERSGDFDRAFYGNSKRSCKRKLKAIRFIDLPGHHVRSFTEMVNGADGQDMRIPIKYVGWLKQQQVTGEHGHLLIDGQPNLFVCRASSDDMLRFVTLYLDKRKGWKISSEKFNSRHMITGPCRIFVACLD